MDPLSDILSLLRPRGHVAACLDAGGDWSVAFPGHEDGIKCGAVAHGSCWLVVEAGVKETPVELCLEEGDCFLLPSRRPFRLASDPRLPPEGAASIFPFARDGVASMGGGGDAFLVSCRFDLAGPQAGLLLDLLPPAVRVRDGDTALRWCIERMAAELRDRRPGSGLVAEHLASMMLVEALRQHSAEGARGRAGWLFALADPRMAAALAALHADPARAWTLRALAEEAAMSRSTFALRFREALGETPMDYLARWRMARAADRLARSADSVAAIAWSVGYGSESAFSTAFKRIVGHSPRHRRKDRPTNAALPARRADIVETLGAHGS